MTASKSWFICMLIFMLAFFGAIYKVEHLKSRIKELEQQNEMLIEKSKPTLRVYNQSKCSCKCYE